MSTPTRLKILNTELEIGATANTVHNSTLIRLFSNITSKVTISNEEDVVIGSFTIYSGNVEIVEKKSSDKISASPSVLCVPIAFR